MRVECNAAHADPDTVATVAALAARRLRWRRMGAVERVCVLCDDAGLPVEVEVRSDQGFFVMTVADLVAWEGEDNRKPRVLTMESPL